MLKNSNKLNLTKTFRKIFNNTSTDCSIVEELLTNDDIDELIQESESSRRLYQKLEEKQRFEFQDAIVETNTETALKSFKMGFDMAFNLFGLDCLFSKSED